MPERRRKFTAEFKDEAVKIVIETSRPVAEVAREIHVNEGTLGSWVNRYRAEHAEDEPPLTVSERARLRELEREVRELRMKTEFLGKPRPSSPRNIGDREVRVHRRAEGELPSRAGLRLAGGIEVGLLRVA
jgi:transposase-like protein